MMHSISPSSDYFSSSDFEFDDDDDDEQEQLRISHQRFVSSISERIGFSFKLFRIVRENDLSDEIFIRSNFLLYQFLNSTSIDETHLSSILFALISLSIKLVECSEHFLIDFSHIDQLSTYEEMICQTLNWDIDIPTPLKIVEQCLSNFAENSSKKSLRDFIHHLIVLCSTDVRAAELSIESIGFGCFQIACQLMNFSNEKLQNDISLDSRKVREILVEHFHC